MATRMYPFYALASALLGSLCFAGGMGAFGWALTALSAMCLLGHQLQARFERLLRQAEERLLDRDERVKRDIARWVNRTRPMMAYDAEDEAP